MTPTPVSRPSIRRGAPPAGTGCPERTGSPGHGVRSLPSTEPDPGRGPGEGGRDPAVAALPARPPTPAPVAEDAVPVPARRAAHALVIMALEVVDRKRAPHHTRGAFPPHLAEMLRVLARDGVPGQRLGPARLHRLHIHAAGPAPLGPAGARESGAGGDARDYEVCATYARGPRLFAVAARVRVTGTGATCTALRLV